MHSWIIDEIMWEQRRLELERVTKHEVEAKATYDSRHGIGTALAAVFGRFPGHDGDAAGQGTARVAR